MKNYNYLLDPNIIQQQSLNNLSDALEGNLNIVDPNNPFMFLLENSANITADNMHAMAALLRRMYPNLATSLEDIFPHFNQDEINNIFSVPSEAMFTLYIYKEDFIQYAKEKKGYYKAVIPEFSTITVNDNYIFTILNNIDIKYYPKSNKLLTKFIFNNDLSIADRTNDIIENLIVKDNENRDWFVLFFPVKQLERIFFKDNVITSMVYKKRFAVRDQFNYLKVTTLNPTTNNLVDVAVSLDEYNINPDIPTLLLRVFDKEIELELPIVYNVKNLVSDVFNYELFVTKGELNLPLTSYTADKFVLTLPGNINYSEFAEDEVFNINQISHRLKAKTNTYGGKNQVDFKYIKERVIEYTTGSNELPITDAQIKEKLEEFGYNYKYTIDDVFKRDFLVNKPIQPAGTKVVINANNYNEVISLSKLDKYSNKIKFIDRDTENINAIVIEPFQIFEKNGTNLKALSDFEMEQVSNESKTDIDAYNRRNLFFNPYKYVLDYNNVLKVRIYDVTKPMIKNLSTYYQNPSMDIIIIISKKTILRTSDNKYKVRYYISPDSGLLKLNFEYLKAQIDIELNADSPIIYQSDFIQDNGEFYFEFVIPFDAYITEDDGIRIFSAYGKMGEALVTNNTEVKFSIYSTDPELSEKDHGDYYYIQDPAKVINIYSENSIWDFVQKINSLFANYSVEYTERKFKIYEEDVYLTYKEDVYELDKDGLPKIYPIDTNGDGEPDDFELKVIHKKGEKVLDEKGQPVVLHKKGDVMLNDDGDPIIDTNLGMVHLLNIFLIDDLYLRTTAKEFRFYIVNYLNVLRQILLDEIPRIDKKLLDNTNIKYLSNFTLGSVVLEYNYGYLTMDNFLEPNLIIYIGEDNTVFSLTSDLEANVKSIIETNLNKPMVKVREIEKEIEDFLGEDVLAVKLELFKDKENIAVINYTERSTRFIISKKLEYNDNKETIVTSNINIKIVKL